MKQIVALFCGCLVFASTYADPNEKVLKAFKETFTAATNVKWQDLDDSYFVSFTNFGTLSRVRYDKEGNITASTRYYQPNLLPINIFTKLKKQFKAQDLFGVTEVTVGDDIVYFVKMSDSKTWTTLKVDVDGNTEVYEKYKKG